MTGFCVQTWDIATPLRTDLSIVRRFCEQTWVSMISAVKMAKRKHGGSNRPLSLKGMGPKPAATFVLHFCEAPLLINATNLYD